MLFALLGIFALSLFIFAAIAFFLPEWVGITGNKAKEVMNHQAGTEDPNPGVPAPEAKENLPKQTE